MSKKEKPGKLVCAITGETFDYVGFGRPPKYSPAGAKIAAKQARQRAYAAKRAASGKSYTPREAA